MPLRIDILTLFPEMFGPVLGTSIPKRAAEKGLVEYHLTNVRDFATDAHLSVDDRPFGGGPGMVMMCQTLFDAVEQVEARDPRPATRVLLSPQGRTYNQAMAEALASERRLLIIAGHYEGFDERIVDGLRPLEVSIGDYVLSGGEVPAMVLVDSIVRLLPGVLGHEQSAADETFADGLIEHPQYTRPRDFRGMPVPDVMLSGNHRAIAEWRLEQRRLRTQERRPDLWQAYLARHALLTETESKKKRPNKTPGEQPEPIGDSHAEQDPRPR